MKIPRFFKNKANSGCPVSADVLISAVRNYDIVSFDIFDTLLKRNVRKPTDVFTYTEQIKNIPGFSEKRILSERKAREHCRRGEITLRDIYAEYGTDYSEAELCSESELLLANDDILSFYRYCVGCKRVVLISDMYLPESFIREILEREGLGGYEKLYLSSSLNKTKAHGDLFRFVLEDLHGDKSNMIHIGDSLRSDHQVPLSLGIAAVHIPAHTRKARFQLPGSSIEENVLNSFINNTIPQCSDKYYRFGYEKFGMFLWGYSKWLYSSVNAAGIKRIFFFSRDGLIMKKAFDYLYPDMETHYLEVSRRALRIPVLWMDHDFEHVIDMISPSKCITLTTLFDGIGLTTENYRQLIHEYGFDESACFDRSEILQNKRLREMYSRLLSDVEQNSRQEYELLVKYIRQNDLGGSFAIVDIGWSGGMQRYLCQMLDSLGTEYRIKGFYTGVADYYKRNRAVVPSLDLNGYLFDFSHDPDAVDRRSMFVGLFETLFLEQAGSVKNYAVENGTITARRYDYEYLSNGEPTRELQCVQKIQHGALDFVRRFGLQNIQPDSSVLFRGIEETGIRPSKEDLELFADFRFMDEGETQFLARPASLGRYLLCPGQFRKDFLLSRWKTAFLKRMLMLPLPYEKIYRYMLRLK